MSGMLKERTIAHLLFLAVALGLATCGPATPKDAAAASPAKVETAAVTEINLLSVQKSDVAIQR